MTVAVGTRLGPYEVVAAIGAGGMGEVCRARDTRLGRDVAIKVLPAEFAADPDRLRRFEQEAKAVAALDHPNILAIHDVGTHEGSPYIVTELLEGESLRDRLKAGSVPVSRAVEIAVQMAQGLAAAHEKGIVHRDLKPGNVFVTKEGHVKILDFGIAKLATPGSGLEPARATTVVEATEAGTVLGTVGYMSPEQVRGLAVDHRSDIFSFGCVLYEMISGRAPFRRDTVADTMSAILTRDPPELAGTDLAVPAPLEHVVRRCLEKEASQRFSSARDLAFALSEASGPVATRGTPNVRRRSAWTKRILIPSAVGVVALLGVVAVRVLHRSSPATPSAAAVPKIAVLPFENLGSPEDAYFASGMTEEITSRLANVHGLGVISRTSAMEYTRRGKTVKEIGKELGVDYVLEGSVRWEHGAGRTSRVRITPQLIRVADDTHVWADRYDRVLADVFAIQSEVAENAVAAMGITLLPREQTALKDVSTSDMQAYELYLRGIELASSGEDRQQTEGALRLYQAAVERDPRFAQALARLAQSHLMMYWAYWDRSDARLAKAKELAERAVALRPDLPEPHVALGLYSYQGLLDYARALEQFGIALKIQPGNGGVLFWIGAVLRRQGRWSEAADSMARAVALDPRSAVGLDELAGIYELARRYDEAEPYYERLLALRPQSAALYNDAGIFQIVAHGDLSKAQAIVEEARRVPGLKDDDALLAGLALTVMQYRRDYQGALRQLEAEAGRPSAGVQFDFTLISLDQGKFQRLAGQGERARRSFEAARLELEQKTAKDPGDHRVHSSLAIAFAGLGRRDDAVREARLACDLMPPSKDVVRAFMPGYNLATVYTMVGQTGEAIATLDDVMAQTGLLSVHDLRLDPMWDPLRSDPRFQALLNKYAIKG